MVTVLLIRHGARQPGAVMSSQLTEDTTGLKLKNLEVGHGRLVRAASFAELLSGQGHTAEIGSTTVQE